MTTFKKTMIFAVLVLGFASSSFAEEKKGTGTGQSVNCPAINTSQDSNKPATDAASAPATNGSTSGAGH